MNENGSKPTFSETPGEYFGITSTVAPVYYHYHNIYSYSHMNIIAYIHIFTYLLHKHGKISCLLNNTYSKHQYVHM